jgi:hypothetical protein
VVRHHSRACASPGEVQFERGDPVQVITGWSRDADYWSMIGIAAPEI